MMKASPLCTKPYFVGSAFDYHARLDPTRALRRANVMCLAAIAIAQHPRWTWLLASNRDEFFNRPAAPLAWWQPAAGHAPMLSGRDLSAGGTWLGLNAAGLLALVTNVREPGRHLSVSPSRGELVPLCLAGHSVQLLAHVPRNGFNLFTADLAQAGDASAAQWLSNRPAVQHRHVGAGVVGLSNAALDTPWPKVQRLKQRLQQALTNCDNTQALLDAAFAALQDRAPAADDDLPSTGVPLERERQLSPAFIRIHAQDGAVYGTRCSTVVLVEQAGARRVVHVQERSFDEAGGLSGQREEQWVLQAVPSKPAALRHDGHLPLHPARHES